MFSLKDHLCMQNGNVGDRVMTMGGGLNTMFSLKDHLCMQNGKCRSMRNDFKDCVNVSTP